MRGFDDSGRGGFRRDGAAPPAGPGRGTGWPGLGGGAARPPARPGSGVDFQQGGVPLSRGYRAPGTPAGEIPAQEARRPAAQAPTPVEAPTPTVPKGGGAIRSIAEKFSANPATGTGSMSVPIAASPGRSGFGPELTLAYDSGAGNGSFGLGWQLSAASIARKTDKGLPQYDDAGESDTFVLSGAEDLVPLLIEDTNGDWQRDAVTVDGHYRERYRPRVESAFARIERVMELSTRRVFWEATTKENVKSIYGKSDAARIADPDAPERVFRWLLEETRDDRGNVILYRYKAEDLVGVTRAPGEHHRFEGHAKFANRYLKRILYTHKQTVSSPSIPDDFHFEIVFDYGEHDTLTPAENTSWLARQDAFSSYRSGFDIRTYRLCRRVLVFHRFTALDPEADPLLVRSTDFTYEESPVVTYLTRVTQKGYVWNGSSYDSEALPPVDFDYSRAVLQSTVVDVDAESLAGIPEGVDGRRYQWVDLDGEGVPGVLGSEGGTLSYKRNLGQGRLAPPRALSSQPSAARLGAEARSTQQLLDVTGDGLPDLVELGQPLRGFHPRDDDETWGPLRPFLHLPNVDWSDPSIRFIDLDGDGFADVVMSEGHVYTWWPSLREEGFGPPRRAARYRDDDDGPTLVFAEAEQTVFLADMTGDGLQDLVRIENGSVVYWPNRGYGDFGPMVTMGEAPVFAHGGLYAPSRVRLADVDGSGPADLLYVDVDGIKLWRNQSGNAFAAEETLAVVPDASALSTVDFVDLLGTGTMCLVWSTALSGKPPQMRYVDLLGSVKPHLLTSVVNNLGLVTTIQYAPSTKFYLEDKAAGIPWATRLPFPVQVVERVEHDDQVSKLRFVSTYRYRHGFYDPEEREFRGFGYVEMRDAESVGEHLGQGDFPAYPVENGEMPLPPVVTKSWFHTGAWQKQQPLFESFEAEWHAGYTSEPRLTMPPMPPGLSPPELHQAHRALAGRLLRQEVYAEDGTTEQARPYTVAQSTFEVALVQPTEGAPYASFRVDPCETLTINYERLDPSDIDAPPPRMSHELTISVDDFGNVLESASIGYGHPDAGAYDEQQRTWVMLTEQTLLHHAASADTDFYRHSVPDEQKSFEVLAATTWQGPIFTRAQIEAAFSWTECEYDDPTFGASKKRLLTWTRERYWDFDTNPSSPAPMAFGSFDSHALPYQSYAKALTATMLSSTLGGNVGASVVTGEGGYEDVEQHPTNPASYWAKSGITHYDSAAFYLVDAVEDVFGNTTTITYDTDKLFVTQVTDEKSNTVTATIDYRVLAPSKITGMNGNWTEAAFDALGRVIATATVGKNGEGDDLTNLTTPPDSNTTATTLASYELDRFLTGDGPARITTVRRETHADTGTRWLTAMSYADGSGNQVLAKVSAKPGLAVKLDAQGHVDPDPQGNPQYVSADPRWVGTGRTVFDNKGNPIKQYEPYFSATAEYEEDPDIVEWGVTPLLRYDPLGRLVRVDLPNGSYSRVEFDPWRQISYDENDTSGESNNLWYAAMQNGNTHEVDASDKAYAHTGTPTITHLDALGRPVVVDEHNIVDSTSEHYITKSALDIQGNLLAVEDPKTRSCMSYVYDMLGQALKQTSIDAGSRWHFRTAAAEPVRRWGERGFTHRFTYDELRRSTGVWMHDGATEIQTEKLEYGEGHTNVGPGNLKGRLVAHYAQAGVVRTESYDFKGNLLTQEHELADDYTAEPDWSGTVTLTGETFTTTFAYDALDRPTSVVLPDSTDIRPSYNIAGLLESIVAYVRGAGTATTFIRSIEYDEKGRRTLVKYKDATAVTFETTYTYDPLTFRLEHFKTERLSDDKLLQSLAYYYDAVGNVTKTVDTSSLDVYFDNPPSSPIPAAGNDFTYDAIYRLIQAVGREHATGSDVQRDENDMPIQAIPHPNNPSGLREYTRDYSYDEVGNISAMAHTPTTGTGTWTRTYTYDTTNDNNHLVTTTHSGGNKSYTHDAHGNMDGIPHLSTVDWDHADQLRHVEITTGQDVYFTYDGAGQRVRKVWITNSGTLRRERIYLGGFEIWRSYDKVAGNWVLQDERETVHIADDARRVCMIETLTLNGGSAPMTITPRYRYELDDHLGSVAVEVDESGNVLTLEEYHPYGTSAYRAENLGGVSRRRYRYNGKERDEETSLYYYGARYYAPWLGRWTAADPAGLVDGPGLYNYCRGSPVTLRDPNGKQSAHQTLQEHIQKVATQAEVAAAAKAHELAPKPPPQPEKPPINLTTLKKTAPPSVRVVAPEEGEAPEVGSREHIEQLQSANRAIEAIEAAEAIESKLRAKARVAAAHAEASGFGDEIGPLGKIVIEQLVFFKGIGLVTRGVRALSQLGREIAEAGRTVRHGVQFELELGSLGLAPLLETAPTASVRLGRLASIGPSQWRSSGGLIYGAGSKHGNRVKHVLAHGEPDPTKPIHSVFNVGRDEILGLVDEAWLAKGASVPGDPGAFIVPMGRVVGTAGETGVQIVVRPGTSEIITAHPIFIP